MASKVILAFLSLACLVAASSALTCYTCNYAEVDGQVSGGADPDCENGETLEGTTTLQAECGSDVKYCMSTASEGKSGGKKAKSVSRLCPVAGVCSGVKNEKGEVTDDAGNVATVTTVCCEGEKCNSAHGLLPALGALLASLLVSTLF